MRALRVIFVLIFMSVLFVVPAQAQAGGRYGFLPLVIQADPATPLIIQAQQAFERLLPQLLAAQESGAILSFEPDFSAGILIVEYAAQARTAAPAGLQGLDDIHAAFALVPHEFPANPVGFSPIAPTFSISLYSDCFYATGLGANSHVIGSLRDKTGRVVANFVGVAIASGALGNCFSFYSTYTRVLPGYRLTFNVYDTVDTLLGTYTAVAPNIAFSAFNKTTSVVSGTGPKNKTYSIDWAHLNLNAGNSTTSVTKTGTIPASGNWHVDFGATKLRGGDDFTITVAQNAAFKFTRFFSVPYAYCTLGSNHCVIYGFPFRPATLTLSRKGVTYTFTGKFDNDNLFVVNLENGAGSPIFLALGDQISGTGIPLYKLPNLTLVPNYTTNSLSGKAPANKYLSLLITKLTPVTTFIYPSWKRANSAGSYLADFSSLVDIQVGDTLNFEIEYFDPVTGNRTAKTVSVGP